MSDFTSARGDTTMEELLAAQEGGGFQIEPLTESPNVPGSVDPSPLPPEFGEMVLQS